jgi:uncharacterized protein (DUF58 family)
VIVPSPRLISIAAAVGFPTLVVEALVPSARAAAVAVMVSILVAAVIDAALHSRSLAGIRVELPPLLRMIRGRDSEIPVSIHHAAAKGPRLRVGLAMPSGVEVEPEERMVDLVGHDAVFQIDWKCHPLRRGTHRIEACYLEAPSPLGLWAVRRRQSVFLKIRIYPNLREKGTLQALRRGFENLHITRQLGRGREFEKLREYCPGDSSEEIHWKATARRGRPITKVFQVERTQEIYLVIDASRLSGRSIGGDIALEWAIKAALTVSAISERRGDLVGIAAFTDRIEAFVRARRGKTHYAAYRDAINELRPRSVSPDFDEIAMFLRLRLRRRCLIVFLTALDDPIIADHFMRATRLLAQRHLVMAATLRPTSTEPLFQNQQIASTEDMYRALAGHLGWRKMRELQGVLGRQGVHLALFEPESFAAGLVKLYDEVKQKQLL